MKEQRGSVPVRMGRATRSVSETYQDRKSRLIDGFPPAKTCRGLPILPYWCYRGENEKEF
jgi:hypothetical protein